MGTHSITNSAKLYQTCIILVVQIQIFVMGVYVSWLSPLIPKLRSNEFPLEVGVDEISLLTTLGLLGSVCGAFGCSFLFERFGRKNAILVMSPVHIVICVLHCFTTTSLTYLYVARFLIGLFQHPTLATIQIYIAEITDISIRGVLLCLFPICWHLGGIFINLIGTYCSIQTTSLIIMAVSIVFMLVFPLVPKSPYYLLKKEKNLQARIALQKLQRRNNVDEEFRRIQEEVKCQELQNGTIRDLLCIKNNRNALIITSALFFFEMFSGHAPLTMFAQTFFQESTTVLPTEWAASLMSFLQIIFSIIAVVTIDLVGRRPLMMVSFTGIASMLFILTAYFILKDFFDLDTAAYNWGFITVLMLYNAFFNIGVATLAPTIRAEVFALSVKGIGHIITSVIHALSSFASTKLYQFMYDEYSIAWALLIFAVLNIVGLFFSIKFLPETKGKSFEEIQEKLRQIM